MPTGRIIELTEGAAGSPSERSNGNDTIEHAIALIDSSRVQLRAFGASVAVGSLDLRDFHALRAILTRLGWLDEETVTIRCTNCDASLEHRPCGSLELGPFVDRELTDPELDAPFEWAARHPIPEIRLAKGGKARQIVLVPLLVAEAMPLFAALRAPRLRLTAEVVAAMGIAALGDERSTKKMARALQRAGDETWSAITNLFLRAHYSPRLFSIAMCPQCGARNDVDAPYERELDYAAADPRAKAESPRPYAGAGSSDAKTNGRTFPTFEAFAERVQTTAQALQDEQGLEGIVVVAEGGVADCDDGGQPLLGSYLPPFGGDESNPSRSPEIAVYYRTFRAIWEEDGPYDWDHELHETLEHELLHHRAHLDGDDPVDDAERSEIARETEAVVGRRALERRAFLGLYRDLGEFVRRTWPIWVIAFIATLAAAIAAR